MTSSTDRSARVRATLKAVRAEAPVEVAPVAPAKVATAPARAQARAQAPKAAPEDPAKEQRPAILVVSKEARYDIRGTKRKSVMAIWHDGKPHGIDAKSAISVIRDGLISVTQGYGSPKAQALLNRVIAGETPGYEDGGLERWNYSVNVALNPGSQEGEANGRTYDARAGLNAGVLLTYEQGAHAWTQLFLGIRDLYFLLMEGRAPLATRAINVQAPVKAYDHLPFNDEIGLSEDAEVVFTIGVNRRINADATRTRYWLAPNVQFDLTLGSGRKLGEHIDLGLAMSEDQRAKQQQEAFEDGDLDTVASLEEDALLEEGWTSGWRASEPADKRTWWLDLILAEAGIHVGPSGGRIVGFTPLRNLAHEVTGILPDAVPVARKVGASRVTSSPALATANRTRR